MAEKLRFAPLVRVSTESQEKMGESLRTQQAQIEAAVKALNGTLIPDPWHYSGQEHSTPGFERKRFDLLLKDAEKGIFDAIIVVDPSRWSRDNVKSSQGLQVLKDNGIRFFAGQTEHDLFDPTSELFLGMSAQINQYVAKVSAQKSMRNRIARASRGLPTCGQLPYGRTFDKKTETWGIDEEKRKKIVWAARQYLKDESLRKIAQTLGTSEFHIWEILNRRSGDVWELSFRSERLHIDEKVQVKVPPLLDPETIRKIHEHAQANRTYLHGMKKREYLLARMIFCLKCGLGMFGDQHGQEGKGLYRYYRHLRKVGNRVCDLKLRVNANLIEEAVLMRIFATLGDPAGLEAAMLKAIPNRKRIQELRERKDFLKSELSKVEARKNRVIDSIAEGLLSKDEAGKKMADIRSRESSIKEEIDSIEPQLVNVPTEEEIRQKTKSIQRILGQIYRTPSRLAKMSFDERRRLVSSFFAGKDSQGRRLGVYIEKTKDGHIRYEIRGIFQTFEGAVTPEGPDILANRDVNVEHLEELKEVVRGKGGKKQDNLLI